MQTMSLPSLSGLSSLTHSASLEWSGFAAELCTLLISAVAASREFIVHPKRFLGSPPMAAVYDIR